MLLVTLYPITIKIKHMKFRTDFLFPDTDFITGAGSVLNISGNYFKFAISKDETTADLKALRSDWGMTGSDICAAFKQANALTEADNELITK